MMTKISGLTDQRPEKDLSMRIPRRKQPVRARRKASRIGSFAQVMKARKK